MTENLNLGMGCMLLPFLSWNASKSMSAWMRRKRRFMVACGICSTIVTITKSGNSWKTRSVPYLSCATLLCKNVAPS
jgi:hypothetical protein